MKKQYKKNILAALSIAIIPFGLMAMNQTNETGKKIIEAIRKGNVETVEELIKNDANINSITEDGYPLVHLAIAFEHYNTKGPEILSCFLNRKNINLDYITTDKKKETALHEAVKWTVPLATLQKMLTHKEVLPLINEKDHLGNTALHYASCFGHADLVAELLKNGASVDIENNFGSTPLAMATRLGRTQYFETIKSLVENGANINNANGGSGKKIELAVEYGDARGAVTKIKATPIHNLAKYGSHTLLTYFILKKADTSIKNGSGETALDIAKLKAEKKTKKIEALNFNILNTQDEYTKKNYEMRQKRYSEKLDKYLDCIKLLQKKQ